MAAAGPAPPPRRHLSEVCWKDSRRATKGPLIASDGRGGMPGRRPRHTGPVIVNSVCKQFKRHWRGHQLLHARPAFHLPAPRAAFPVPAPCCGGGGGQDWCAGPAGWADKGAAPGEWLTFKPAVPEREAPSRGPFCSAPGKAVRAGSREGSPQPPLLVRVGAGVVGPRVRPCRGSVLKGPRSNPCQPLQVDPCQSVSSTVNSAGPCLTQLGYGATEKGWSSTVEHLLGSPKVLPASVPPELIQRVSTS